MSEKWLIKEEGHKVLTEYRIPALSMNLIFQIATASKFSGLSMFWCKEKTQKKLPNDYWGKTLSKNALMQKIQQEDLDWKKFVLGNKLIGIAIFR